MMFKKKFFDKLKLIYLEKLWQNSVILVQEKQLSNYP